MGCWWGHWRQDRDDGNVIETIWEAHENRICAASHGVERVDRLRADARRFGSV